VVLRSTSHAVRFYTAVALGVAAVSVAIVFNERRPRVANGAQAPVEAPIVPWCAQGLEPIPGGGCFASPPRGASGLAVYLHGRYTASTESEELARQARVAKIGVAHGYAVLALRGKQGECTDPSLRDWWCWPSNEKNVTDGPRYVAEWEPALAAAEKRVGRGRRVLLGFSNGGYFAGMIATRAYAPFEAVVVAHAGPVSPIIPKGPKPPMLLLTAEDDPSHEEIMRLSSELAQVKWPHQVAARDGGHELPEQEIQWAFDFFERTASEPFPLSPPIGRAPRKKEPVEASVEEAGAPPEEEDAGE
jgi:predicted esterase